MALNQPSGCRAMGGDGSGGVCAHPWWWQSPARAGVGRDQPGSTRPGGNVGIQTSPPGCAESRVCSVFPPPTAFTSLCCWAKPGEEKLLLPKGGWQENCWTPPMAVASTWLLSPLKAVNFVCRVFLIFHSVAAAVGTTSEGWEQHKHSPPWEHCLFPFCRSQIPQLSPHLVPPTVHLWFFFQQYPMKTGHAPHHKVF